MISGFLVGALFYVERQIPSALLGSFNYIAYYIYMTLLTFLAIVNPYNLNCYFTKERTIFLFQSEVDSVGLCYGN